MSKDILIVTNYYPPEIGAASNRIYNLATGLSKRGFKVSVVTPLPNYPHGKIFKEFKERGRVKAVVDDVIIYRLWVYASNSKNKFKRLLAMLSYSISLIAFFLNNKIPNKVIIQSPPLLVAFTSVLFLKSKKRKLFLNVSDLWPLAGLELGVLKKGLVYKFLSWVERYNYKSANLIMGQSNEILAHVKLLFENKDTFLYRNYPAETEVEIVKPVNNSDRLRIVYAGLLGHAQGIFKLVKKLDYSNTDFHIYGSGAEKEEVEEFIASNPEIPVFYNGELPREELLIKIQEYDLVIIPLLGSIYGSVPSKIFEFALIGMPILYFGGGEGEKIVKDNDLGWSVESGDYQQLNKVISSIESKYLSIERRLIIKKAASKYFTYEEQLEELTAIIS